MPLFFQLFLSKMKANFHRIAKATRNEVPPEDLKQDAWLIADEIGKKRGRPIDFSSLEDQELVMRAVNHRNVKRGDWQLRKAIRIDKEEENEDGAMSWIDLLQAPLSSDPLMFLLLKESALDTEAMLANSYSQASAYIKIFAHFKNIRKEICSYLAISDCTLARRVATAAEAVKVQHSLFDHVERISSDFLPPPGRQYVTKPPTISIGVQWSWKF